MPRSPLSLLVLLALTSTCHCTSESPAASTTAVGSGGAATGAATGATSAGGAGGYGSEGDGGTSCPPKEPPPSIPAGWVHFGDWSCDCELYVPSSPEALPEPIAWEPCPGDVGALECQSMVVDWLGAGEATALPPPHMFRRPDGTPALAFRRNAFPAYVSLVADIDGPVHEALIALWNKKSSPGCMLTHMHAGDDRYVTKPRGYFYGGNYMSSDHQGVIGGVVGELEPRAYLQEQTSLEYTWYAGGTWIARTGTGGRLFVFPWSDPKSETLVTSSASDPEGLVATSVVLHGDAVFFDTTSSFQRGINVFTPTEGAQPFIRWVGDATRGARNFGTDGVDMVWSYGEGKAPTDTNYPTRSIMTAPYTADPNAVDARRLRSHPHDGLGAFAWKVGCGYAAGAATGTAGIMVVRLADGWAWQLEHLSTMKLGHSLGVTCDELFAWGSIDGIDNIARIKLDSLGPGIPPD